GHRAEQDARASFARTRREDRADDNHGADRVGDAHQRRVQRRRDVPDDVIADEDGEDEDGEADDGVINRAGHRALPAYQTSAPAILSPVRWTLSGPVFGSRG